MYVLCTLHEIACSTVAACILYILEYIPIIILSAILVIVYTCSSCTTINYSLVYLGHC